MNDSPTYVAVTEIFRAVFRDDTMELRPGMTASEVEGWDSFKQVEILLAVQGRFAFKFSSRDIDRISCVGDLVNVIERRMADIR